MAGAQVEVVANQIDKQRLGYMAISLLEYDTDAEPEIAEGSKVEVAGALFEFTADESITGWAGIGASNDVYIKLVVAGTAVTAEFTTTAPTWSTSKQGWYGTAGAALDRYVAKLYKDGASAYTVKRLLTTPGRFLIITTPDELEDSLINSAKIDFTLDAGGSVVIDGGSSWTPAAGIYVVSVLRNDAATCYHQIYQGGSWRGGQYEWTGGVVVTDGASVRLTETNQAGTVTIYYRKIA